jgi:hypothetical protein
VTTEATTTYAELAAQEIAVNPWPRPDPSLVTQQQALFRPLLTRRDEDSTAAAKGTAA